MHARTIAHNNNQARHQATPALLKSGEWGARVLAPQVGVGDQLTVVTKGGSSWEATVRAVVWQGEGVVLCRTDRAQATRAHSGYCSQCGRRAVDCSYHAAMGGLCGQCAFDEYDM
ncbi:TPA: hypothetical protein ACKP5X_000426 [Stenotrophomonas maltophilia]